MFLSLNGFLLAFVPVRAHTHARARAQIIYMYYIIMLYVYVYYIMCIIYYCVYVNIYIYIYIYTCIHRDSLVLPERMHPLNTVVYKYIHCTADTELWAYNTIGVLRTYYILYKTRRWWGPGSFTCGLLMSPPKVGRNYYYKPILY